MVADGNVIGVIGARDRVRASAHDVIHDLKHLGLKDLTILTGDRLAAARAVAKKVHIKHVEAELTPAGKADWIEHRRQDGRIVAMVGDGINDGPALARADVGLAIAGVGSDLAAEAGSVILMGDPLTALPETIRLCRHTVGIIRQNILVFAFGLNALAVVLAGLRVLEPVSAAILHQIGSLLVLLNAMRILGFERWGTWGFARRVVQITTAFRRFRPSTVLDTLGKNRVVVARVAIVLGILAYAGSGITIIGPDQVGLLRRFGRYQAPALRPGLHFRLPAPIESVVVVEPELSRVARIGLSAPVARVSRPVAWGASHGTQRNDSALFFTGDESLVELAGVVEYHYSVEALRSLVFGVVDVEAAVAVASEGAFREEAGRTPLEGILVEGRRQFEGNIAQRLRQTLQDSGLDVIVDRVRVVDAHPPREVVPAYRDVSTAVSDTERSLNQARADASQRRWAAKADAEVIRDAAATRAAKLVTRTEGEKDAFLAKTAARREHPALTEFRLLWDAMANTLAGRPKLILDRRAVGRRHVWLTGPERLSPTATPASPPPELIED